MTPHEQERIRTWSRALKGEARIRLIATEDQRSREIARFCEDLAGIAAGVQVIRAEGDPGDLPAIGIGRSITFHGVPLGTELAPFLEALSGAGVTGQALSEADRKRIEAVDLPALLQLFVTPQCRFCPGMVRQVLPLAAGGGTIHLAVVDSSLFPEKARSEKIQSVPTLVLDNVFRWTGTVDIQELLAMIERRDPLTLGPSSLENMLTQGDASRLAGLMLKRKTIFPAFVDLLAHRKWPVRLGAMVALEEISEKSPELAGTVAEPLWERFEAAGEPVKGDILHVLGEIGDRRYVPALQGVLDRDYGEEITEAAKEALEKIAERMGPLAVGLPPEEGG